MIPVSEDQSLYEMAKLTVIDGWHVYVVEKEGKIPHFHMSWPSVKNYEKICYIRIDKPEYFDHGDMNYRLSHSEKKALVEALESKNKYRDESNWNMLILLWNLNNGDRADSIELPNNLSMPDYMQL